MRMLDLFCGRWGWSRAFAARGHECVGVDLQHSDTPKGCILFLENVLNWTPDRIRQGRFDFGCASSPCENFSLFGMRHFHPDPPHPEDGIKLFNYTRWLFEEAGIPYVMENVRSAQQFVGPAVHHCGPFYLWGNAVPPLVHRGIDKGMSQARDRDENGKRIYAAAADRMWSTKRKLKVATIPPELANCVAEYAERICEASVK